MGQEEREAYMLTCEEREILKEWCIKNKGQEEREINTKSELNRWRERNVKGGSSTQYVNNAQQQTYKL